MKRITSLGLLRTTGSETKRKRLRRITTQESEYQTV